MEKNEKTKNTLDYINGRKIENEIDATNDIRAIYKNLILRVCEHNYIKLNEQNEKLNLEYTDILLNPNSGETIKYDYVRLLNPVITEIEKIIYRNDNYPKKYNFGISEKQLKLNRKDTLSLSKKRELKFPNFMISLITHNDYVDYDISITNEDLINDLPYDIIIFKKSLKDISKKLKLKIGYIRIKLYDSYIITKDINIVSKIHRTKLYSRRFQ